MPEPHRTLKLLPLPIGSLKLSSVPELIFQLKLGIAISIKNATVLF